MDEKAKAYFSEGAGMPYPARPYKSPDKTNEKRNTKVPIDIFDLNKPGVGPVDIDELTRGRRIPSLTTRHPEGQPPEDID